MVGRLVEKQNVCLLHQPLGNHEAFAPTTRQGCGGRFKVDKTGAAQRLGCPRHPLRLGYGRPFECLLDYRSDRLPRRKIGHLRDIAEPAALARRHLAAVRLYATVENFQQRRLAGTVRPNQADPVAFRHGEGDILE